MSNYELMLKRKAMVSGTIKDVPRKRMATTKKLLTCEESNGFRILQNVGEQLSVPLQKTEYLSKK